MAKRHLIPVHPTPIDIPPVSHKAMTEARHGESFPVAWMIAAEHRPAVMAYYAFARQADDIADAPSLAPDDKRAALDQMGHTLRTGQDNPCFPQAARLREELVGRDLPLDLATDLLIAFRQDCAPTVLLHDSNDLDLYCRYSAVPVGRFLIALHGQPCTPSLAQAVDALCMALQGLNHLQGLKSDWVSLHRCYLPLGWLQEAGALNASTLPPDDTLSSLLDTERCTPALRRAITPMLAWVLEKLHHAHPLPQLLHNRRLAAQAATTLSVAHSLARRLDRQDPLASPVHLSHVDWARAAVCSLGPLLTLRGHS